MKSEYLDLFEAYFSQTMSERDIEVFERRLETDSDIKKAFTEYRHLRDGIDYSIMKTLKEELQQLEATLPEVKLEHIESSPEVNASSRSIYWKMAATVLILAMSTLVILHFNNSSNPQDLFNQHFEPYPNEFVSAKRGDDISSNPMVSAFQAYDNQDYQAAEAGFNNILEKEEDIMVMFYLGSAQLAQNDAAKAIATFERFLEISNDSVADAKWYLALGYLKADRLNEAKSILEELKQDNLYGKRAEKILRKLD